MTVSQNQNNIKTTDNKIKQNKAHYDLDDKILRFQLYDQEMLVDMNF